MTAIGPFEPVERENRQRRYNSSEAGKARAARYRASHGRPMTHAKYLSREFIAWDGEGVTDPLTGEHRYVLLDNSLGHHIVNPMGLSSSEIFRFVWDEWSENPDAIHVIYGGGYDFNMWFSDFSQENLQALYDRDFWHVGPYKLQWRRGKSLWFKRIEGLDPPATKGAIVYDVVSFFQTSFVKACDAYLGTDWHEREMVVRNKALRSSFTMDDLPDVLRYCDAELVNLVRLMTELRLRLDKAGLRPSRWDGPGAIASALLSAKGIKKSMATSPEEVSEAVRFAYAGGRFEMVKYGIGEESVYEYDINSAYPAALSQVPDLARGGWRYERKPPVFDAGSFAVWHVRFRGGDFRYPQPLFYRFRDGAVLYPGDGGFYGWYWTPDIAAAIAYCDTHPDADLEILAVWEFVPATDARPFGWIPDMYTKRQLLKAAGDGAHVGYKLALNSLYGKTAQQVGARRQGLAWHLPPFHQLEWAGYVTSWCRSQVYTAALQNLESVVAFETDALFTTAELDVPIGTGLGQWERTEFQSLTYIQSGTYFGTTTDGEVVKTRGVNAGSLTRDSVETAIRNGDPYVTAPLTSFITAGLGLRGRWDQWRRWITADKQLTLYPNGKRIALPDGEGVEGFKMTYAARVEPDSHSCEFPILWVNPDAGMDSLELLRETGGEDMSLYD
jgi:hypothetical protein